MPAQLEREVIEKTFEELEKCTSDLQIAKNLRNHFETEFRNSIWHCIIGRNFAANITFETGYHIYFNIGPKAFLLFKTI